METEESKDVHVMIETTDAISVEGSDLTKETTSTVPTESTVAAAASHETIPAIHSYQIKPSLADKFKAGTVKEIMRNALTEKLHGKSYEPENVKKWTVEIANEVSFKLTELKMKRYKHIVQVTLGEHKGAGVKSGVRCLWDAETDGYTSEIYSNDTIFCLIVVYAIYVY